MDKDEKRKYDHERYLRIRPQCLAQAAEYYSSHRQEVIQRARRYVILHPEQTRAKGRKWDNAHKDKISQKGYKRRNADRDKFREYMRENHLKTIYGLTMTDYQSMLNAQEGVCAICGGDNNGKILEVDHSHRSGKVRGLLCRACNTGIGFLRDDLNIVQSAYEYLKKGC